MAVGFGTAQPKSRSVRDKRFAMMEKLHQWRRVRRVVLVRDGRRCRVCRSRDQVDAHHIKFRSAGGKDTTSNVAAICRSCHDDVHAYRLSLDGDANKTLRVTRL